MADASRTTARLALLQQRAATAPVLQRKISYKTGQYRSKEELIAALVSAFGMQAAERITTLVESAEAQGGRVMTAGHVFNECIRILGEAGLEPNHSRAVPSDGASRHGPMLPNQVSRTSAPDPEKALRTFNFPSVTLARLTVIPTAGGDMATFHDRQIDANFHAEDGLRQQLIAHLKRENAPAAQNIRLNLTINNFFCTRESTGKAKASQNCLEEMIAMQAEYRFKAFHVYFQNPYGPPDQMVANIQRLQAAGIQVTPISSTNAPPLHYDMADPESESSTSGD